ncbi:MAG: hypothetical protein ACOY37_04325 [Pseudomonadota bacterium]
MKVQFTPASMRIRVDQAEFGRLRAGTALVLGMPGAWRVEVAIGEPIAMRQDGNRLAVALPAAALEELAARLPSRDGIAARVEVAGHALDLAFEVDMRDGRPRRPR